MAEGSDDSLSGQPEVCRTFSRNGLIRVTELSPREPYLSFTIGPHPWSRLVIKIWSHDQGSDSFHSLMSSECHDDYHYETVQPLTNSHTWFALGIIPDISASPRSPDEPYLCEIHRNLPEFFQIQCHLHEWRPNTPFDGHQSYENEAQGWLDSIPNGSPVEVGVFPLAEHPGWVNYVYEVEVKLYYYANTVLLDPALSPQTDLVSSNDVSQMIGISYADAELTHLQVELQSLLNQIPNHDPENGEKLHLYAIALGQSSEETGSIEGLEGVIDLTQLAIGAMPDNHPSLAAFFSNLRYWFDKKYGLTRSIDDLVKATEASEKAIEATPDGHPNLISLWHNLARTLKRRYEHTRSVEDLTRAIEMYQKAAEAMSGDHLELTKILDDLGWSLTVRYSTRGAVDDLTSAIRIMAKVIEMIPSTHPGFPRYLYQLGCTLHLRFQATGSTEDLERAIEVSQGAVDNTPDNDHRALGTHLKILGMCFESRFEQTLSMDDLDTAIGSLERAISIIPDKDPHLADMYGELGGMLGRKSDQDSLTRAIEVSQKAITTTGEDHQNLAMYLGSLSTALFIRFGQTGSVEDLTGAIEAIQRAIRSTRSGQPSLPTHYTNLASYLGRRYELIGLADDLTRGIEAAEKAVEVTPPDDTTFAVSLSNLSAHLVRRYRHTKRMDDLTRAIRVAEQAVTKSHAAGLSWSLTTLGIALSDLYEQTRSMDDLMRTIDVGEKAVEAARHNGLAICLSNLGKMLLNRYDRTKSIDDLTRAVETSQKAVGESFHDAPYLAMVLRSLGNTLGLKFERTGAKADQDAQLCAYTRACRAASSSPSDRLISARAASVIHASRAEWKEAYDLSREAVLLLPKISPRSLKQSDMQKMLSPTSGLASAAAAMAFNAGKSASEVLSILELARGVIAGILIDSRGDLSDLRKAHPSLAGRFEALREELHSPSLDSGSTAEFLMDNRRHEAGSEFNEVIEQIRAQDGFGDFLQPPPTHSLMKAADSGPIVVVNLNAYRSDAILVENHTIRHLKLSGYKSEDIINGSSSKKGFWYLLEWLWTTTCKPCLDALGFTEPVGDGQWPHVWWVPIGVVSRLPLHAAGIYSVPASRETVLDRAVSSYASSIKALQHSRQRWGSRVNEGAAQNDAVLIGMEQTKGQASLPYARQEIDKIRALCPLLQLNATTPPLYKADILEHLKHCQILHFAGHGVSREDPSQSCLILDDWETNPLTVADLRESWLQERPAFLAYLSACSTGSNRAERLSDEAIHLVSAFQLAGFRHVVGTLWEVSDPHCVDVAAVLYQTLCDEGMTDEAVSYGLHRAIRKLRDDSFRGGG